MVKRTKRRKFNAKSSYKEGLVYFLGAIGAAVYYISNASGFWNSVLGFLKALAWPAFLVHGVLKFLGI